MSDRKSPFTVATNFLKNKFSNASVAFVAGSIMRGEQTKFSDIDLVIILPKVANAWRESCIFEGWPIEAFIHDLDTLNYFLNEDAKSGVPSLQSMVLEGRAIPENHELVFKIKSLAETILEKGPEKWTAEIISTQRYRITDLIDDIREPRNQFEANVTLGALHETLGNFYFRTKGIWSADRKHIPRRLSKVDPELYFKWVKAFENAYGGNFNSLIELAGQITSPFGGLLFDGYRLDAPKEWSSPLTENPTPAPNLIDVKLLSDEINLNHPSLGQLTLRPVRISDVAELRTLLNKAYRTLLDLGLNYNATFQDETLTLNGLGDGGSVIVVVRQDQIIATVKVKPFNPVDSHKSLYLSRFAVLPEYQKFGLGSHLLVLAEKIARREGFECMQLDTAQPAKHLIEYYQSQGFKIVRPIYYDAKTYLSWVLQKNL